MILYKTIKKEAVAEQVINKSRFITHIKPVFSREEAEDFIRSIKKEYKDATHNVPAFVIGENQELQWASDDGEPQGTSGAPMVHYLVEEGITNIAVVVTRYFGGIKLGTGGLVRAYTSSAKLGVQKAGVLDVKLYKSVKLALDYSNFAKFEHYCGDTAIKIGEKNFLEKVYVEIFVEPENLQEVKNNLMNVLAGKMEVLKEENKIVGL